MSDDTNPPAKKYDDYTAKPGSFYEHPCKVWARKEAAKEAAMLERAKARGPRKSVQQIMEEHKKK